MAVTAMSNVTAALATLFQSKVIAQMNRSVVLLQLMQVAPAIGQNLTWDTEFRASGEATDSTIADGADVSVYEDDDIVPAVLQFGTYSQAFGLTGKARAAARNARSPEELVDLFGEKLERAVRRLTKNIARDIYTGSGSNRILGLLSGNAIDSTGVYAGIDRATYADWAATELANGGTPRALTFALMREMRRSIYVACGEQPDLIVTDPIQFEKYGQLFDGQRRYNQDVFLRGNKITLSGGYKALDFDGIPVIQDTNCPAGKMLFLNSSYIRLRQMADSVDEVNESAAMLQLHGTAEEQFNSGTTGLMARLNRLARTGDAYKFQMILYPQLQVERPNAQGVIADLS